MTQTVRVVTAEEEGAAVLVLAGAIFFLPIWGPIVYGAVEVWNFLHEAARVHMLFVILGTLGTVASLGTTVIFVINHMPRFFLRGVVALYYSGFGMFIWVWTHDLIWTIFAVLVGGCIGAAAAELMRVILRKTA